MYLPALLYLQTKSKHSRKRKGVCFGVGLLGFFEKQHKHKICQARQISTRKEDLYNQQ